MWVKAEIGRERISSFSVKIHFPMCPEALPGCKKTLVGERHVLRTVNVGKNMSTEYRHTKQITRLMAGSSQLLAILMSMLRRSLEAAWSMARVWIEYAYTHRTGGQTPCADRQGQV
jgi:hypothetical protein